MNISGPLPAPPTSRDISCNIVYQQLYKKQFPYGRWNNTNSNLKLFPMTIFHDVCGNIVRKQTKNIFQNTAMRMSQKQVYSYLMRNGIGPYTR
jgi:hypothetical protein